MINKLIEGLKYRGREGQWAWILHRLTGVGVFLFLFVHIYETSLICLGEEAYNSALAIFHTWYFRIAEVFLGGAVLYHALNGVRIVIIDFWENSTVYHRRLFWIEMIIFFLIFIPGAIIMLTPILTK